MATTKEQEKLVLEFCENTGADKEWAYSVLARKFKHPCLLISFLLLFIMFQIVPFTI